MPACWNSILNTVLARLSVIDEIRQAARRSCLEILGTVKDEGSTILLLGPYEPGFWPHVSASAEFADGQADPMDRWSKRVIHTLAESFGATAIYPSDGPPYPPFISWALASGRAWHAPVGMLVQETAGLFVSYRGALRLEKPLVELGSTSLPKAPCETCHKPCQYACPVDALGVSSYDVQACKDHITGPDSKSCKTLGCAARRACPISQTYPRMAEQSAFHMRAFLGE